MLPIGRINKSIEANYMSIHPDIQDLLWIKNGSHQNWDQSQIQTNAISNIMGMNINISCGSPSDEPSLIDLGLPVSDDINHNTEPPGYYPSYKILTPEQRRLYWEFLRTPFSGTHNISYVFLFYYGLERHLFQGNYEKAADIILKLRQIYDCSSFPSYSAKALFMSSIIRNRQDIITKLFADEDTKYYYVGTDLFLIYRHCINDTLLSPKDILDIVDAMGLYRLGLKRNSPYRKSYPEIFMDKLSTLIGPSPLYISSFLNEMYERQVIIFANYTLKPRTIMIPAVTENPDFINTARYLLQETHELVKEYLKEYRKKEQQKNKIIISQ